MKPLLSILIPTVPSRIIGSGMELFNKLTEQIAAYQQLALANEVEVLMLLDNKQRNIGLKRDALVQAARGAYLAFVDDDDTVSDDYVASILDEIDKGIVDVIVFDQHNTLNGENPFIIRHGLEFENEPVRKENGQWVNINRKPWHHCVWRTDLAQRHRFPDASYGEDWHWCERVLRDVKTQSRINKVLHYYRYDDKVTEAKAIFPT